MNKINKLLNEEYVIKFFKEKILEKYSSFSKIKKVKIIKHKKYIWEETYHVVFEFRTYFLTKEGKVKIIPIFCSAHSGEPRKNTYYALQYLWNSGFSKGFLTTPHPLFYSNYFKGMFYRGVDGKNLYHYIKNNDFEEIERMIPKAASWLVKLHKTSINEASNFNKENSRIKTVFPGIKHILREIEENFPEYYDFYKKAYKKFIDSEKEFLKISKNITLIHGDAHPENFIKMGRKKIAMIDFTDISLSDFARDLGCFLQQFEFMAMRKIGDSKYVEKIKNIFLEKYLEDAKIKMDDSLEKRINIYYNWTAIRTATYFLLKYDAEPERGKSLIESVKENLNL